MTPRSLLFVPADAERKLARARESDADALILDLEDSVAPTRRSVARGLAKEFLSDSRSGVPALHVRINPLAGPEALVDLAAVMPSRPDAILLPKATPEDLARLDAYLAAFEAAIGIGIGATEVICIATETPAAVFSLGRFGGVSARLSALTWGAEDLAALLGAASRLPDGCYDDTFRLARALCLLAAQAAAVAAIDTVFVDFRDEATLIAECAAARRAGFVGKLAIHPAQVGPINAGFSPGAEELDWARTIVAAFTADPNAGTIGVGGRMVDRPHLLLAQRILARHAARDAE
jgi:citrate lyase subunit beta/citryl-CoA lyase